MSLFNNMSTKNDILTFTLPSGGERGRTDDLLNANQALYQLSYSPIRKSEAGNARLRSLQKPENSGFWPSGFWLLNWKRYTGSSTAVIL